MTPALSRCLLFFNTILRLRRSTFRIGHHGIHLDQGAGGQLANRNHGAGGLIIREVAGIDGVDRFQILDTSQLDIDLDDIVHHMVDALHNRLDMVQALGGLLLDATGQDLAGGEIDRQLPGDMVVVGEGDGLGVQRAARCLVSIAGADHQIVSVFHQLRRGAVTMGDDSIHLHQGVHRQGRGGNHAAGRQIGGGAGDGGIREEGGVDLVDGIQIGEVFQIDGHLDDIVEGHVNPLQNGLDVIQALGRLLLDATGNQLAGGCIDGQLGADVVVVGEGNGLGGEGALRRTAAVASQLHQSAGGLRIGAFAVGDDGVHLNLGAQRQGGYRQGGAGRHIAREEFAIDLVDRIQIGDVAKEYGEFHHIVHHVIDALDDGLDIGQALSGLHFDITFDQLAGAGIDR